MRKRLFMQPRFLQRFLASAGVLFFALASGNGNATPHIPQSDNVVVERLSPALLSMKKLRGTTTPNSTPTPLSMQDAVANARHYVELGQTYSDPRAYGYAQAALGSWWNADNAPVPVLIMRARILQFRHQFRAALGLLETAVSSEQFNPEAWLLIASIEQVQGNIPAARAACLKVIPVSDPLVGATCAASTGALSGASKNAEQLLSNSLDNATAAAASERVWAWTTLAEIRARSAANTAAVDAFKRALALEPDDVYARAAYADLLLDENQPQQARAVLGDAMQADALLLRAAIAAQRNHDADAGALRENLAQRFFEARERGDESHLREQSRFALDVEHNAPRALELALKNFAIQREPADARLLLEAASAAQQPDSAKPVIDWLASTHIEVPHLQELARALAGSKR